MKRFALFALGIFAVSASAPVRAQDDATAKAVLALPANLRDAATVIKWKSDFTYDTLKKGTSQLVCYDLTGYPKHQPFTVECTSTAYAAKSAADANTGPRIREPLRS